MKWSDSTKKLRQRSHLPLHLKQPRLSELLGSLSKGVFERRMPTGSEKFSLFTRLGATAFVILSDVTRIETIILLEN